MRKKRRALHAIGELEAGFRGIGTAHGCLVAPRGISGLPPTPPHVDPSVIRFTPNCGQPHATISLPPTSRPPMFLTRRTQEAVSQQDQRKLMQAELSDLAGEVMCSRDPRCRQLCGSRRVSCPEPRMGHSSAGDDRLKGRGLLDGSVASYIPAAMRPTPGRSPFPDKTRRPGAAADARSASSRRWP